jgi:hypothetical protein
MLNYQYCEGLQVANFCKMAGLFGSMEGIFGPVIFSTSKYIATCPQRISLWNHSSPLTVYPRALQLDTGGLHAIRQNPHRMSSSYSLIILPVSQEVSLPCALLLSLGAFVAGFCFCCMFGWPFTLFQVMLNVLRDSLSLL